MATQNLLQSLREGIVSRVLPVRDLDMHILEAGQGDAPLLLLLHGYPELAFSWHKVILPLANLGYHVIAPDLRGYGQTRPRDPAAVSAARRIEFEDDFRPYSPLNLVHDVVALVSALGYTSVAALIGHDFGSFLAGNCAFARPDLFERVVFISVPYAGPPPLPFASDPVLGKTGDPTPQEPSSLAGIISALMALLVNAKPPRKHYMYYSAGSTANWDMLSAQQGLHDFLRAYFHLWSADWAGADEPAPHQLSWTPGDLEMLPPYYIMPAEQTIADVARTHAPTPDEVDTKSSRWLPEADLGVFVGEFGRTGFQGALNWYRGMLNDELYSELSLFAGRRIEVPTMYIAGKKEWAPFQIPGSLEQMREVCTQMVDGDVVWVEGAGHWVPQEQPEIVVKHIARFLKKVN